MNRVPLAILAGLATLACERQAVSIDLEPLDRLLINAAKADAYRYMGEGSKLVAICGPSRGVNLFLDQKSAKYTEDAIDGGVIALGLNEDQKPDLVHRDALKQMIRVTEDEGAVEFLADPSNPNLGTWIVRFDGTGITEVHSLVQNGEGELFDMWMSTRPKGIIPARTLAFLARCERA